MKSTWIALAFCSSVATALPALPCGFPLNDGSAKAYSDVFIEFMDAVGEHNPLAAAKHIKFPVETGPRKKRLTIRGPSDFSKHFAEIFTPEFTAKITKSKPQDVVCNWRGAGVANGSLWLNSRFGESGVVVEVVAINNQ